MIPVRCSFHRRKLADALQEAADSMALEGYKVTPEMMQKAETHIRENHVAVFKQLNQLRDKCFPKKDSIAV